MKYALLLLFYLLTPAVIIHFSGKYLLLRKAGNIILVYILGLIIGNGGMLPDISNLAIDHPGFASFASALGVRADSNMMLQEVITNLTIPLALPLLLMTLNFNGWTRMAGRTFISMVTGMVSVIIVVLIGNMIFSQIIPESWKISGLLIGVYTGGTPNLAAIKTMLDISSSEYILVHSSDLLFSGVYLLFLMSLGKPLFKRFLPETYYYGGHFMAGKTIVSEAEDYSSFFKRHNLIPTLKAFGVSITIFAIGGVLSMLVPAEYSMVVAILSITLMGVSASFNGELRRSPKTYELGMYLIMVFSLVVASMADFKQFNTEAIPIFLYVSFTITLSLILHLTLSRIFKVDAETMMITSTALICSPPFVPVIAGALNNRKLIISGLTVGIVGYAVGNFLGVSIAYILR
ncbi:MAG: DUF819 family protein [Bacteroidales bacterium]|nr:DUF819 family protein [Bacteroidales bacterium]